MVGEEGDGGGQRSRTRWFEHEKWTIFSENPDDGASLFPQHLASIITQDVAK